MDWRAETGVLGRPERVVRATPGAAVAVDDVVGDEAALPAVGRCGVPVGVSRPDDAGGFLATLAIIFQETKNKALSRRAATGGDGGR